MIAPLCKAPSRNAPLHGAEILCFLPRLDRSGAPQSALALLEAVRPQYPATALVVETGPLEADYHRAGIPVVPVGLPNWLGFRWRHVVGKAFADPRLRGLHINNLCREAVPVARLARRHRVPVLWHVREDPHSSRARRLRDSALRLSDCIVTVSEEIRCRLFGPDALAAVVTVHNGVRPRPASPSTGSRPLVAECGWEPDSVVIVLLGRLVRRKGVREFLEAARLLTPEQPRARFLLMGAWSQASNADRDFTREMQERICLPPLAGKVRWIGESESPPGILEQCDVVALPSWWEGSSRALLEAMACGRAVVVSDVGGNPEIVEHGASGLLVPPRDPLALKDAFAHLAGRPEARTRLGEVARARVARHFSLSAHCARMSALYEVTFRPRQEARIQGARMA